MFHRQLSLLANNPIGSRNESNVKGTKRNMGGIHGQIITLVGYSLIAVLWLIHQEAFCLSGKEFRLSPLFFFVAVKVLKEFIEKLRTFMFQTSAHPSSLRKVSVKNLKWPHCR